MKLSEKIKIKEIARSYGIDISKPLQEILSDLSLVIKQKILDKI